MLEVRDNPELTNSFRQSLQAEQDINDIAEDILSKLKDPAMCVTLKDDIVLTFDRVPDGDLFHIMKMERGLKTGATEAEEYVHTLAKTLHKLSKNPELDLTFFEKLPLKYKALIIKQLIGATVQDAKNAEKFR